MSANHAEVAGDEVRRAYEYGADAWARGPARVYARMAEALIDQSPVDLAGALVLDLGTGTGTACEVLRAHGARAVGVDLAEGMLRHGSDRAPASVGDALRLPFRSNGFDAVVAAFSLNHLPDPRRGLAECGRVTRPGGVVLASTFPLTEHPAKAAIEEVLQRFGYERPPWYETFKADYARLTAEPDAFTRAATEAGLIDVVVKEVAVDAGLADSLQVTVWRLNMPHTIGFVQSLESHARDKLYAEAVAAVPEGGPSTVAMLTLCGWVRA